VIEVHTSEHGTHLQSQLITSGACCVSILQTPVVKSFTYKHICHDRLLHFCLDIAEMSLHCNKCCLFLSNLVCGNSSVNIDVNAFDRDSCIPLLSCNFAVKSRKHQHRRLRRTYSLLLVPGQCCSTARASVCRLRSQALSSTSKHTHSCGLLSQYNSHVSTKCETPRGVLQDSKPEHKVATEHVCYLLSS